MTDIDLMVLRQRRCPACWQEQTSPIIDRREEVLLPMKSTFQLMYSKCRNSMFAQARNKPPGQTGK